MRYDPKLDPSDVRRLTRNYKHNEMGGVIAPTPGAYRPQFPEEPQYSWKSSYSRYYDVYSGPWVEWAKARRLEKG